MEKRKPAQSSAVFGEIPPGFGARRIPLWMAVTLIVLFLCTQNYVYTYSGKFRADVYDEHRKNPPEAPIPPRPPGNRVFTTYCAPCHQLDGLGIPGIVPPLAGSEWVNAESPDLIIRIVLDGASGQITVRGASYNNVMLSWRDMLTNDTDIAAVLSYVRSSWGNRAPAVTVAQVQAVRASTIDRRAPWQEGELRAIPAKD